MPRTHAASVLFPGCTLLFYESDGRSGIDPASTPKHAVWVEDSIVQAVPEHPKKDFVFCLSNSVGDAFLFQVCRVLRLESEPGPSSPACTPTLIPLQGCVFPVAPDRNTSDGRRTGGGTAGTPGPPEALEWSLSLRRGASAAAGGLGAAACCARGTSGKFRQGLSGRGSRVSLRS